MKPKLTTRILKYLLATSTVIAVVYALIWMVLQGYSLEWTGFADFTKPTSDFTRGKTLWDWMELFIIPIFLSIGVFLLNRSERDSDRQRAEERGNLEREIAAERQREAALQAYLDRMTDLLLKEKLQSSEIEEVRNVARIRTLTVLRGLDATRKGLVVRFLQEANLIFDSKPIIDLNSADLTNADLYGAKLHSANLHFTFLTNANLGFANLNAASLRGSELQYAVLCGANLNDAHLSDAFLMDADLRNATLYSAFLIDAYLKNANLSGADLRNANLKDADLSGADLSGVNLRKAKVTKEQLATVKSLKGATMPDGTKHD